MKAIVSLELYLILLCDISFGASYEPLTFLVQIVALRCWRGDGQP